MTERLYYTDSYLTRFEARVVERAEGGCRLYLDRTAFYPTSGGQPHDTGLLGGARVLDVADEDARIAHVVDQPVTLDRVQGEVDWARRFDHMQQHTGQHLLSAVFAERFGWATTSVHFGPESSTLDLATEGVSAAQAADVEARANALVAENRPVRVSFEDAATATGLRKPPPRPGVLRVVSIEGLDRSPCGGTHVRATGEIGPILLRKIERVRKRARIEFLCGARAIRAARADFERLARLGALFSASPEDVPALVERLRQDAKESAAAVTALRAELARHRARELHQTTSPGPDGLHRIVHRSDSLEDLRALAQAATALPRTALFGSVVTQAGITVLLATSPDSGTDAGATLKQALAAAGGRGGGTAQLAQGTVPDPAAMERVLASLGWDRGG
jgi:alanyl-tRNA synthetase